MQLMVIGAGLMGPAAGVWVQGLKALLGLGLVKGDRVALLAYNCLEWMELYVALARGGLVA